MATTVPQKKTDDFKVADLSLAEYGRKRKSILSATD